MLADNERITPQSAHLPELLQKFEHNISSLSPITRALYTRAAKRSFSSCRSIHGEPTPEVLLLFFEQIPPAQKAKRFGRVHRFERFVGELALGQNANGQRFAWIDQLAKMSLQPLDTVSELRDYGLLAAWATLKGDAREVVTLTLKEVAKAPSLAIRGIPVPPAGQASLRHWLDLRLRTERPEQARLFKRSLAWADSAFIFPNSRGGELSRSAVYNALRRLQLTACQQPPLVSSARPAIPSPSRLTRIFR
jgi:hypothetical protein